MFLKYSTSFIFLLTISCFLDDSDEPEGLVRHLPSRLLKAAAQKRTKKKGAIGDRLEAASTDEEDDEITTTTGRWSRKDTGKVGSKVPVYIKPVEDEEKLERLRTASALQFYKVNISFISERYV